ncbi:MAG: hypothetical protein DHS20C11_33730 [Lysobacteraceae bacterium]|nr:MAG: hypothetical protein DHS20C11_33730 [Xanthomonadaceae bacterium]
MLRIFTTILIALLLAMPAVAQDKNKDDDPLSSATFNGMKWRNIGPGLMSGRIADIALRPDDPNTWYIAVGSGGVWKTTNAGTTWTPVFDNQSSYSIGAIALDPSNPHVVWVGTGENVGGRHVGYGDGIYRSVDGGASWEKRGLEASEHISKIIVHPSDSDTIFVAAQGPLWSPGGERGFYKTTDGGETWTKTLGDDKYNGVTDILIDPRDPDTLYAATWQHHRNVAALMDGGPETGIHKSTDGGETWTELSKGLPEGNMGKIGLALSPQNPDVIYAAIELDRRKGGVWRSTDRGASWEKRSDTVSGGTGPHYYQELYASPHHDGWLYLMSNTTVISKDGGKTFEPMSNEHKHGDDHAMAFRADDPDYVMFGSDGGLYESFDHTETWRYIANLPVTQFYKVAVDDDAPFYNVYGGTQDNNSQGGPSRTDNMHGIRNSDWFITLFGDGHQPATEPGNPDIVYSEWQQGNLVRYDRTVGEIVYIKPQGEPGDPPERFNWDAPILVSPHQPTRLYFASQRVWRSDNRGDTWTAISGDLTRDEERVLLPVMGRQQSWDAPWDMYAMSQYNTITSLAQSPLDENILYAGTDDGLISVTADGGENWQSIEVGSLPGVPSTAFVNDIKADLFDADTVYIALDNHKYGDYKPYLLKSTDRGRRWKSIASDLPERHLVWRVVQDHVKANLMFAATEFGVFFTIDGGGAWIELDGDMPVISLRDLAIQRRENDLVAASFGRGFFILDDYSPLREITAEALQQEAALLPTRDAWWYIERTPLGFGPKAAQGDAFYTAPNPPFGAVFTYYLKDELKTLEKQRQDAEKSLIEEGEDTPFPGWNAVVAEQREPDPGVVLTVRDSNGEVVRRVTGPVKAGVHRVAWDLRYPATQAIGVQGSYISPEVQGHLAAPGDYTVELAKQVNGETTPLAGPVSFSVNRMNRGTLHTAEASEVVAFWKRTDDLQRQTTALNQMMPKLDERMKQLGEALQRSRTPPDGMDDELHALNMQLADLKSRLSGTPDAFIVGQLNPDSVGTRLSVAQIGTMFSSYGPTPTHIRMMDLAEDEFASIKGDFNAFLNESLPAFEKKLLDAGAPWVPGMPLP